MATSPTLNSYEIPYLANIARQTLQAELNTKDSDEKISANDIGFWVYTALKLADIVDESAWRVSSAVCDHVLEQERNDGSKYTSFASLGKAALLDSQLNRHGRTLCFDLFVILGRICKLLGVSAGGNQRLSLLEESNLAIARVTDYIAIIQELYSYGVIPPNSRPEDIDLDYKGYSDSPSAEAGRNFQRQLHNLATRAIIPTQIVCQLMAQMIRDSKGYKTLHRPLEEEELSNLSFDPQTLHESVRAQVLEYLKEQDLLKRT